MDLSLFLVADYANASSDGKLYIMGVFNNIMAAKFPVVHQDMHLVVQLTASPYEYQRSFLMQIKLVDQDMQPIIDISANGLVPQGRNGEKVTLNNIIKLVNTTFPAPGPYEFSVQIDQDLKGILPLELILSEPPMV